MEGREVYMSISGMKLMNAARIETIGEWLTVKLINRYQRNMVLQELSQKQMENSEITTIEPRNKK